MKRNFSVPFVLGSASPRRESLLERIGIVPDEILPADIDETMAPQEGGKAFALRMAVEKAEEVARQRPNALVLGADTVVACGKRILQKPDNADEARAHLSHLSGRKHLIHGGVCLCLPNGERLTRTSRTWVTFKHLSHEELDAYIASGEWDGKAGAYAIQGLAACFVSSIRGSYTNIVGLPIFEVNAMLTGTGLMQ